MEYRGELEGFPKEVVDKMLERQVEAGFSPSIAVFEKQKRATNEQGGFIWGLTEEGGGFWEAVVSRMEFDVFFEKYPKNTSPLSKTYLAEGTVRLMETYYDFRLVWLPSDNFSVENADMDNDGYKVASLRDFLSFVDDDLSITNSESKDKIKALDRPIFRAGLISRAGKTFNNQSEFLDFKKMETYPPQYPVFGTILYLKKSEKQITKEDITIDSFIQSNKDELEMLYDENPVVFDAVNDVLAELRVVYEGADPTKIAKVKPKVVEEDDDIDFDDMDDMMDDLMDDLLDDIDDFEV